MKLLLGLNLALCSLPSIMEVLIMADRANDFNFPSSVMRRAPKLGGAAMELQQSIQAPYKVTLASALSMASVACQGLYDMKMPYGAINPLCLSALVIAESGERKTASFKEFTKALLDTESHLNKVYESILVRYKSQVLTWRMTLKGMEKEIKNKLLAGESTESEEWCLEEHLKKEPEKPMPMRLLFKDVSPSAMLSKMSKLGVAALISSEGGEILDSKIFDAIPHLNSAWSGDSINLDRLGKPPVVIDNPRITICLMLQPDVLAMQSGKKDKMLRGSGHWSRYLVFSCDTTQGSRFSGNSSISRQHTDVFNKRESELLARWSSKVSKGELGREVVLFSNAGADLWTLIADRIEAENNPGRRFQDARDHASKLAENIARVAGVIHCFEGFSGGISAETVQLAADICEISSDDYLRTFVPPPQEMTDAAKL